MQTLEAPASLPLQIRAASVSTVNAEARTCEVVFATPSPVRCRSWEGAYDEILVVSNDAVNLDRLNAGGPVLDTHNGWSLDAIRAVVEKAWVKAKEARALVRFPTEGTVEQADRCFALVQQGIVRNVSAGYTRDQVRIQRSTKDGEVAKWFIERWTPWEISFCPMPLDPLSQVRANGGEPRLYPVEFLGRSGSPLGDPAILDDAGAALARMRMLQAARV